VGLARIDRDIGEIATAMESQSEFASLNRHKRPPDPPQTVLGRPGVYPAASRCFMKGFTRGSIRLLY
jgi:hypothetical protein